jgi:hypothetical protein
MSLPRDQRGVSRNLSDPHLGSLSKRNKKRKSSTNDTHPYLKASFWDHPSNQFWETDSVTQKGKEYFRSCLTDK